MATTATDLRLVPSTGSPSSPTDLDPRSIRHSDLVKELACACYVEARGNCAEAARMVAAICVQDTTGAYPKDTLPTAMAIRRWAAGEGWRLQLSTGVAQDFPATITHLHARLALMGEPALDTLDNLSRPEYAPTKEDRTKLEAAKFVVTLLGLGTAGAKAGQPTLTVAVDAEDEGFLDAAEANRYWIRGGTRDE